MAVSPQMQAMWNEVKANHKRLNECQGPHDFVGVESELRYTLKDGSVYGRYVCKKCNGKVFPNDKIWYERGIEHGKKEISK